MAGARVRTMMFKPVALVTEMARDRGAGEMKLAEVADEHEGHYVDGVLQEAAGDHRPGEAR